MTNGVIRRYFATAAVGLEPILAEEIKELGSDLQEVMIQRGKVFFQMKRPWNELLRLRCADNVYRVIGRITLGKQRADLARLAEFLDRVPWRNLAEEGMDNSRGIHVSASRKGTHAFSRFELMDQMAASLRKRGFVCPSTKEGALQLRADLVEEECILSMKLTDAAFRYRRAERVFVSGGIRPTVAAALVLISKPCRTDVVYDPFCGAGTITEERASYPARRILASDWDEERVRLAEANGMGKYIVFCADARNTPSAPASVDALISNPPWNRQVAVADVGSLYADFLREADRILKPTGRMVLLTDCHEELAAAAEECGFDLTPRYPLSLHGLHPIIYELRKDRSK
ncbi:methyltransferase [Gorillibacterium sp. CAU 1737]|uniref:methyltransferase n=1 Tax=Gorillibacterium sp. CAU 1737 TaxID=3140362 RepID=UPI00326018A6